MLHHGLRGQDYLKTEGASPKTVFVIHAVDEKIIAKSADRLKHIYRNQAAGREHRRQLSTRKTIRSAHWFTEQSSVHFVAIIGSDHGQAFRGRIATYQGGKSLDHIRGNGGVLVQGEGPFETERRRPTDARV